MVSCLVRDFVSLNVKHLLCKAQWAVAPISCLSTDPIAFPSRSLFLQPFLTVHPTGLTQSLASVHATRPQAPLPLLDLSICAALHPLRARPVVVLHRMPEWQASSERLTSLPQAASPASLRDSRLFLMRGLVQGAPVLSVATSGRRDKR